MAQFNIRYALLNILDGYAGPGGTSTISHGGGYSGGATTMTVAGFTGAVANGDYFSIAGDLTPYKITAHTETLGNTTSITFTPGLAASAADASAITILAHKLQVKVGEGTLSYEEKRQFKYVTDRGFLDTVRQDADVPLDVKIEVIWEWIKSQGGDPPTIEDAMKKRANAAAWISSSADPCEVYSVDVEVVYQPPCNTEPNEIILLQDFRYESIQHDLKNAMFSVAGKCNVTEAVITRNGIAY